MGDSIFRGRRRDVTQYKVNICPVCFRTDAFKAGHVDCDKEWHKFVEYIKDNRDDRECRKSIEKVEINIK